MTTTDSTSTPAVDFTAVVDNYLDVWNAADPGTRLTLMASSWSEDASYTDPLAEVTGLEAISAVIGQVQQQFAGMGFSSVGQVDGHHRQVRFQWGLGEEHAEPLVVGFDVVTLNSDGLIADVRGFLDRVPS